MLNLFAYIGYFLLFINIILFNNFYLNKKKALKIFILYLGVTFIIQVVSNVFFQLKINNLFISHFYFIGQFIILSFFYFTILKENYQKKIVQIGFISCLLILGIHYLIDSSKFYKFDLFEIFITSFLVIIYATFHLYNLLNEKKEFYYLSLGILLYLYGSTILFLVGNITALLSFKYAEIPWILNSVLYIVFQLFICREWKESLCEK